MTDQEKYRIESIRKNANRILILTRICLSNKHVMSIDKEELKVLIEDLNADYKRFTEGK